MKRGERIKERWLVAELRDQDMVGLEWLPMASFDALKF